MMEERENLIYGRHPVLEALKAEKSLDKIYIKRGMQGHYFNKIKKLASRLKIPFTPVEASAMARICPAVNHQGVAAILSYREYDSVEDILEEAGRKNQAPLVLILNEVQDTGNLGSLIRSAVGAGFHGMIIGLHRSAQLTSAASKVSAGADSHLKIARVTNITDTVEQLKNHGLTIVGADQDGETMFHDYKFSGPLGLVLGGEEKGLGTRVKKSCDILLKIPLRGKISSLNVGVAGGILMFHMGQFR